MMGWVGDSCITHDRKIKTYKILNTQVCSHITKEDPYFLDTVLFKAVNA